MARLEPLKTLHEARSTDEFVEAFVVEIPAKLASRALRIVKPVIPNNRFMSFHHLRRLCTLSNLPIDLTWRRDYDSKGLDTVFLLLPSTVVSWKIICATLAEHIEVEGLPRCFNAVVPRSAPLNAEQARLWSERYWPCIYNPASQVLQDAPPLHQLRRIQTELDTPTTDSYIQMAKKVAEEAANSGFGKATGAVIVNPETRKVVAVAGDARWWNDNENEKLLAKDSPGRAEYHSLMRAIAIVANKELRRRLQSGAHSKFASTCTESPAGRSLLAMEKAYADPATSSKLPKDIRQDLRDLSEMFSDDISFLTPDLNTDVYLCSGLDVYLSHEPCVCCAMAMIHSRFRSCVFQKRMPKTGSLVAEKSQKLAYGLFWRRELNWRVMTFRYRKTDTRRNSNQQNIDEFHA